MEASERGYPLLQLHKTPQVAIPSSETLWKCTNKRSEIDLGAGDTSRHPQNTSPSHPLLLRSNYFKDLPQSLKLTLGFDRFRRRRTSKGAALKKFRHRRQIWLFVGFCSVAMCTLCVVLASEPLKRAFIWCQY